MQGPFSHFSGAMVFFCWLQIATARSFAALSEVRPLDARGNAVSGDALAIDSDGCVVMSEGGRLVAAVGLHEACVIDSGDAVLVVPKDRAQDVRKVVDALRRGGRADKT